MGHNGSYMAELDPTVYAATYIIKCTAATGHEAIGSVVKWSEAADYHRAEILIAVLLQLVLRAASTGICPIDLQRFSVMETHQMQYYLRNKQMLMFSEC